MIICILKTQDYFSWIRKPDAEGFVWMLIPILLTYNACPIWELFHSFPKFETSKLQPTPTPLIFSPKRWKVGKGVQRKTYCFTAKFSSNSKNCFTEGYSKSLNCFQPFHPSPTPSTRPLRGGGESRSHCFEKVLRKSKIRTTLFTLQTASLLSKFLQTYQLVSITRIPQWSFHDTMRPNSKYHPQTQCDIYEHIKTIAIFTFSIFQYRGWILH